MKDYDNQEVIAKSLEVSWATAHEADDFESSLTRWMNIRNMICGITQYLIFSHHEDYAEIYSDLVMLSGVALNLAGDYSLPLREAS